MSKDDSKEKIIIDLLIKNEESISRLYQKYSKMFNNSAFWQELAKEERIHAQWLKSLTGGNEVRIKNDYFNAAAIEYMINSVENQFESDKEISLIEGLATSISNENSMLEKDFFKVFETDNFEVKNIMDGLAKDTARHAKSLEEELQKEKIKNNMI